MTTGLPNPRFIPGRKPRARDTRDRGTINTQHPPRDSVQRPRSLNLDRNNASCGTQFVLWFSTRARDQPSPDRKSATKHTDIKDNGVHLYGYYSRYTHGSRPDYADFDRVQWRLKWFCVPDGKSPPNGSAGRLWRLFHLFLCKSSTD